MARDRDPAGRPRNARPRDQLGRPLARDADGVSEADPVASTPAETLHEAQQLLDGQRAFRAHEVFEAMWKAAPDEDRALWRGLAQIAVGMTHIQRGNMTGASSLLARGAATLSPYAGTKPHGVDVDRIRRWAHDSANDPRRMSTVPRLAD